MDNWEAIENAKKNLDNRLTFLDDLTSDHIQKLYDSKDKIEDENIIGVIIGLYKKEALLSFQK